MLHAMIQTDQTDLTAGNMLNNLNKITNKFVEIRFKNLLLSSNAGNVQGEEGGKT